MPIHDTNPMLISSADFRRLEQKIDRLLELFEPKARNQKADFDVMFGHDGMPIYNQTFSNNGLITVEGEGHRREPGFSINMNRNNVIVQYSK